MDFGGIRSRVSRLLSFFSALDSDVLELLLMFLHWRRCSGGVMVDVPPYLASRYQVEVFAPASRVDEVEEDKESGCGTYDTGVTARVEVLGRSLDSLMQLVRERGVLRYDSGVRDSLLTVLAIGAARKAYDAVVRGDANGVVGALSLARGIRIGRYIGFERIWHVSLSDVEQEKPDYAPVYRSDNRAYLVDGPPPAAMLYMLYGYWFSAAVFHRDAVKHLRVPQSVDEIDVAFVVCMNRVGNRHCAAVFTDGGVLTAAFSADRRDVERGRVGLFPTRSDWFFHFSTFGLVKFLRRRLPSGEENSNLRRHLESMDNFVELAHAFLDYLRTGRTEPLRELYLEYAEKFL